MNITECLLTHLSSRKPFSYFSIVLYCLSIGQPSPRQHNTKVAIFSSHVTNVYTNNQNCIFSHLSADRRCHFLKCFHSVQLEASGLWSSKQHLLSLLSFYLIRLQPIQIDILTLLSRGGGDEREKRSPQRIYAGPLAFKIGVAWSCLFCCGNKGQIRICVRALSVVCMSL